MTYDNSTRTAFASKALQVTTLFETHFSKLVIGGDMPRGIKVSMEVGESTGGGKMARESIMLVCFIIACISFPLLCLRFLIYFFRLLLHGRRDGVGIVSYHSLFNPLNLLFMHSLLNVQGQECRRRCLVSLLLMAFMLAVMILAAGMDKPSQIT